MHRFIPLLHTITQRSRYTVLAAAFPLGAAVNVPDGPPWENVRNVDESSAARDLFLFYSLFLQIINLILFFFCKIIPMTMQSLFVMAQRPEGEQKTKDKRQKTGVVQPANTADQKIQ